MTKKKAQVRYPHRYYAISENDPRTCYLTETAAVKAGNALAQAVGHVVIIAESTGFCFPEKE